MKLETTDSLIRNVVKGFTTGYFIFYIVFTIAMCIFIGNPNFYFLVLSFLTVLASIYYIEFKSFNTMYLIYVCEDYILDKRFYRNIRINYSDISVISIKTDLIFLTTLSDTIESDILIRKSLYRQDSLDDLIEKIKSVNSNVVIKTN